MKKTTIFLSLLAILLLVLVLGCKQAEQVQQDQQTGTQILGSDVIIQGFKFSPEALTVKKGTTVTWMNEDSAPHTIASDSGKELDSPSFGKGETYSHTFDSVGKYDYHCGLHPSMKATIIVE